MPTGEQRAVYAEALARVRAAEVRKTWLDWAMLGEPRPYEITAIAEVFGLDPETLWDHVEGVHGWEPHDEGYEDAVWAAAECDDPEHLSDLPGMAFQYTYTIYDYHWAADQEARLDEMVADGWQVNAAYPNSLELYILWQRELPAAIKPDPDAEPAASTPHRKSAARDAKEDVPR